VRWRGGTSKADYVKQANAVCRDAAKQVAALRIPARADIASMPKAAANVVAVQRKAVDRLRAIKPPKQDRAESRVDRARRPDDRPGRRCRRGPE